MHLLDFCRLHGVILDREPPIGVWKRYPTQDKPTHRNGAVKHMGTHAFHYNKGPQEPS
jgi:putative DNA primase/helicase